MFSKIKSNVILTCFLLSFIQLISIYAIPVVQINLEKQALIQRGLKPSLDKCTNPVGCPAKNTQKCSECGLIRRSLARLIEKNTNYWHSLLRKRSIKHNKKTKRSFFIPQIVKKDNSKDPDPKTPLPGTNCPPCHFFRRGMDLVELINDDLQTGYLWLNRRSIKLIKKIERNFNEFKFVSSIQKRRGRDCETNPNPVGCPQQHDPNCPGC